MNATAALADPDPICLTAALGQLLAGFGTRPLSAVVLARAEVALLDTLGVMFAGRNEPVVTCVTKGLHLSGAALESAAARALLFGTAAHALDYDDVAFGGHVSAVIVPALLAMLPFAPAVDGRRLLAAYAAGFEAWAEVSARETTLYHARGLHPTGLLGPIGAAAAVSVLLGQDAQTATAALGIAASTGAGLLANFGFMAKPLHAGRAAEAGVMAALMAQAGLTASAVALEAQNGFLAAYSPHGAVDLGRELFAAAGHLRLDATGPNVKCYPVCYAAHRNIDAALALHAAHRFEIGTAARIELTLSPRHDAILRYTDPETVAQARFSLEYCVASALVRGHVGLADLDVSALFDPAVRAAMARMTRSLSDATDPARDGFAAFDQVRLVASDGTSTDSPKVHWPLGHANNPLSPQAAAEKSRDCLRASGLNAVAADAMIAAVRALATGGAATALNFSATDFST